MALFKADLLAKNLLFAFDCFSAHGKSTFPEILSFELFTVDGAMIIILLSFRPITYDIDVSRELLETYYVKNYLNIKSTLKELYSQMFMKLIGENIDLGSDQWLNYATDTFLATGLYMKGSELIIGPQMVEKAIEDNIVLFQNDPPILRFISFTQTIFQKLEHF